MNETSGEVSLLVTDTDTAIAQRSGDVPVLSTPRVLALAEQAAVHAIADRLQQGQTSVGIEAVVHHVKATRIGKVVRARAKIVEQKDKTYSFEFSVSEDEQVVAYGTHRRVVVDRDRFLGAK